MSDAKQMRAEFMAWVSDRGCDTDGAWSAWQGAWNLGAELRRALKQIAEMDPNGQRADDLGKAARIARAASSKKGTP